MRILHLIVFLAATSALAQDSGRPQLIQYLNRIGAKQTAVRRTIVAELRSQGQAQIRQQQIRTKMLQLLGPLPERTPLHPVVVGETILPGMRIQKVMFDSQPRFHVTALLYLPDTTLVKPFPAIVMAPGHSPAGKAGDFAFASAFVRNGFAVLSYDPIGQGERLQYPDPADPTKSLATRPTGEHGEAGLQPVLLGESVAKYFLWDGMRAVDYLLTRPEVDGKRIGAFGCSGGGSMTALLGALDTRIAAIGTACYLTSFDTLLPSIGPQDGEQSTPGWIAAGLDFPDWAEVAAPRPYAIIATTADMFPFAGAEATEAEARNFYRLFDADQRLAFITGPGGHGNLRPILPRILKFFIDALHPEPFAAIYDDQSPQLKPPASALQVTPTGQVSVFDPGSATVFSLNLDHARALRLAPHPDLAHLQAAIRKVTSTTAIPATNRTSLSSAIGPTTAAEPTLTKSRFQSEPGISFDVQFAVAPGKGKHPAALILADDPQSQAERRDSLTRQDFLVAIAPTRPSPAGTEELKSPLLGPYYLLGLRAELVGKTLLGMRVDDVIRLVDALARRPDVDPSQITAEASGHLALVLLHAAVLDPRIRHVIIHSLPPTYAQLLANPLPKDAPQDILPGVLHHYDTPDLLRVLGPRVTVLPGQPSTTPPLLTH